MWTTIARQARSLAEQASAHSLICGSACAWHLAAHARQTSGGNLGFHTTDQVDLVIVFGAWAEFTRLPGGRRGRGGDHGRSSEVRRRGGMM